MTTHFWPDPDDPSKARCPELFHAPSAIDDQCRRLAGHTGSHLYDLRKTQPGSDPAMKRTTATLTLAAAVAAIGLSVSPVVAHPSSTPATYPEMTSTTAPPSTYPPDTTTLPASTTTTSSTTTTVPAVATTTSTTTTAPIVATGTPPIPPRQHLPATGTRTAPAALIALAMLIAGCIVSMFRRRVR